MSQNRTSSDQNPTFGHRQKQSEYPHKDRNSAKGQTKPAAHGIAPNTSNNIKSKNHIAWFDYAKGICIILVVMMHSVLGVEKLYGAEGFMHYIVAFAKPFRMPDFFFLSALFLPMAMPRTWRHYLDKKVVHFAYFYVIWLAILMVFKAAGKGQLSFETLWPQLQDAIINPYPTLWFIDILPLFFVVTKLLNRVPGWLLFLSAALLQISVIHTGWRAIDEFAVHYYVFFIAGYLLSPHVFELAKKARENVPITMMTIGLWAIINGILAFTKSPFPGWDTLASLPVISIVLGLAGAVAVTMSAALLSMFDTARFIRFCGRNSIMLYLSFTIPMAVTRLVIHKLHLVEDPGMAALITWLVAVTTPLLVYLVLRRTPLRYLYIRPHWAGLSYETKPPLKQAACTL